MLEVEGEHLYARRFLRRSGYLARNSGAYVRFREQWGEGQSRSFYYRLHCRSRLYQDLMSMLGKNSGDPQQRVQVARGGYGCHWDLHADRTRERTVYSRMGAPIESYVTFDLERMT